MPWDKGFKGNVLFANLKICCINPFNSLDTKYVNNNYAKTCIAPCSRETMAFLSSQTHPENIRSGYDKGWQVLMVLSDEIEFKVSMRTGKDGFSFYGQSPVTVSSHVENK